MRKYIIAGNWKMHKDSREAAELSAEIVKAHKPDTRFELVICPTFTSIAAAVEAVRGTDVAVGGQNICWEEQGAFTGEISAGMLLTSGCKYVILGHSERRQYFSEDDRLIGRKVELALSAGLLPIVCLGEKIEDREAGKTENIVGGQFDGVFADIEKDGFDKCVIAYEPVWAIGTGKTATPEMAEDVHRFIREKAKTKYGEDSADGIRILYGGSMKPENAAALLSQPDIDGGLIGGASLKSGSFIGIADCVP